MEVESKERVLILARPKPTILVPSDRQSETTSTEVTTDSEVPLTIPGEMEDQMAFYTKLMIMACLINEFFLSFALFCHELFLVHALPGFCTPYAASDVLRRISRIKFITSLASILFGLTLDSHLRRLKYWAVLSCGPFLILCPSLYLVLAYPVVWEGESAQESRWAVFYWGSILHGMTLLAQPTRVVLVLDRTLGDHKVADARRFIGLLVFSQQCGQVAAGLAMWICRSSRKLYTGLMCANIVLCSIYCVFWFFWTHGFARDDKIPYFCVERAIMSSACYIVKSIDRALCKGVTFKKHYGWQDYRCIHFSERTAANTWCLLTSVLVLLPLVGFFVTDAGVYYLYISQYSLLLKQNETYSVLAYKATYFVVLYPIYEFLIFPWVKKFFRRDLTRVLFSIGTGCLFMGLTIAMGARIQQKFSPVEQDVVNVLNGGGGTQFAHVVVVNLIDVDCEIRGDYVNRLLVRPKNAWKILKPYDAFKVLNVPSSSPFNISVRNDFYRLYDDYSFNLKPFSFNWLMVHPIGMSPLPTGTFHQKPQIGMNPSMYRLAYVNIICLLPVCEGILEFRKDGRYHIRVFFPSKDEMGVETLQLAGTYEVGFSVMGNKSTETTIKFEFFRLKVYLLVISVATSTSFIYFFLIKWHHKSFIFAVKTTGRLALSINDMRTKIVVIQANHEEDALTNEWIMLAPTFFHALAHIFTAISLLEWLQITCRPDLKCFIFSIPTFLSAITYGYFAKVDATSLQTVSSIKIFSYACAVWILLILYGVTCLRYMQLWNQRYEPIRPLRESHHRRHRGHPVLQGPSTTDKDGSNGRRISGEKDKDS